MAVEARVFVLPGGRIQVFIDSGTEEEARAATRKALAVLQASGIPFADIGTIELHRAGAMHVHAVNEVRNEQ